MTVHSPILLNTIVEALIEPFLVLPESALPHVLVDCTLGGGGHTAKILEAFEKVEKLKKHRVLAIDQDLLAVSKANERFKLPIAMGRLEIHHGRFSELLKFLKNCPVLGVLADLGFSSDQLEDAARGLSFLRDGPLDMRMDRTRGESCFEFLSHANESEIARVLFELGEERFSRRIASALIHSRHTESLPKTTKALSELVVRALPQNSRHGRIHAATRTFQALRIHINQELDELDFLLTQILPILKKGGRAALISFHSLEDRRVKQAFKNPTMGMQSLTRKPIGSSQEEREQNPRARSAKLRIGERI
jgi:16S rRNA (cytosine1402-N4)-methyltransferase